MPHPAAESRGESEAPRQFAFDTHPAVRASAARLRIVVDEKRGLETPQWIVDLASTYPDP